MNFFKIETEKLERAVGLIKTFYTVSNGCKLKDLKDEKFGNGNDEESTRCSTHGCTE